MRILNLTGGASSDGAVQGAINMHEYLYGCGHDSYIYIQEVSQLDCHEIPNLIAPTYPKYSRLKRRFFNFIDTFALKIFRKRRKYIFSPGVIGYSLDKILNQVMYDLIIIHWNGNGFINLKALRNVKTKIIWIARDYWLLTAGCHIPYDCTEYEKGCSSCVYLGDGGNSNSVVRFFKQRKTDIIQQIPISIALISEAMFRPFTSLPIPNNKLSIIGNMINIEYDLIVYRSISVFKRNLVNKSGDIHKPILLIMNQSGEPWKNSVIIEKLMDRLLAKYNVISFGRGKGYESVYNYGYIHEKSEMARLMLSADGLFFPSLFEPFGKIIYEAGYLGCQVFLIDREWSRCIKDKPWVTCNSKDEIVNDLMEFGGRKYTPDPESVKADIDEHNFQVYSNLISMI